MRTLQPAEQAGDKGIASGMDKKLMIATALRSIGLALHATHGVIATDLPDILPSDVSWRVNNSLEIIALEYVESQLNSICTDS
ncbi:MAG: hypothetical protein RBS34_00535 [Desulfofustis sp.]|jgi:hypothetical protein|nr:hypothetical protein [Desulfofustis sp.]